VINLPIAAQECADRWGFVATEELVSGNCSRVFANARQVLKVPFQGEELTSGYRAALKLADAGGPSVIASDPEHGIVLMDRVIPGTSLATANLPDGEARRIALGIIARIQGSPTEEATTMAQFFDVITPLRQKLIDTTPSLKFLHGDLHHGNILRGENGWVVIDPKGLVGDPAYEPVAFMRNPMEWVAVAPDLLEVTRFRAEWFAHALAVKPSRIIAWGRANLDEDIPPDDPWYRLIEVYETLMAEYPNI
jgi:streptomycin 6-kinase